MKVRIEINESHPQALITSEDGSVRMYAPIELVRRRMGNETTAYFDAQIADGSLEIGERIATSAGGKES